MALNIQKGNTGSFSRINIDKKNVMDKIWDRKSEVIGCCGGDEKPNDHVEPTKSRTLKKIYIALVGVFALGY